MGDLLRIIIGLGVYVYMAIALQTMAKKTNTKNSWLAWIPIANVYLMTQIAGISGWYTLTVLLLIIPLVGYIAMLGVMIWFWWKIAEAVKKPGWLGILIIIPFVNLVVIGYLAFSK